MEVIETKIPGLLIVKPKVFGDARGFFFEGFNQQRYLEAGIKSEFIQDNYSSSQYGVIRGLHYQLAPYAQAKLVQVLKGKVLDVAVDLRQGSPTFGQFETVELSDENRWQFFIPRGFAHGFSVLSEEALFHYKCDNLYNPQFERGIHFNDPQLGIDWKISDNDANVSPKDKVFPMFSDAEMNFIY
jgi:dTDP-4-dehydrorhamnose 3,5-epimerase